MCKKFKTAPIPFQGQKRFFVNAFESALQEISKQKDIEIVVDLFGGSGLLSHVAKRTLPNCQVIYNDFDDYHKRLLNLPNTNRLLAQIRAVIGMKKNSERLDGETKNKVIELIENETEPIDFITLSASLLFSAKYVTNLADLKKQHLYNNVKQKDYESVDGYLDGLDIVRQDYQVLFERYKHNPKVLFLIDPPYLSTDVSTYTDKYWKIADYLNVLLTVKNVNYVYFTSSKSNLVELLAWFEKYHGLENPFNGAQVRTHQNRLNKTASYVDMMLYKWV